MGCQKVCEHQEYVLHQAALGSVPRSLKDPITSNEGHVTGFLNMLVAARDQKVARFIFAASSSTYGDTEKLPKVEDEIGKPLSPYAITKYVNELYADIFQKAYGLDCIGLRYFNVFAMITENKQALNEVYNTAVGDRTTLIELLGYLKQQLSLYDAEIANVEIKHGPNRPGDVPHSLASVDKAKHFLDYQPSHTIEKG